METQKMIKAVFSWDDPAICFAGYYDPSSDWNGFVVPFFDLKAVKAISEVCYGYRRRDESQKIFYILDNQHVGSSDKWNTETIDAVLIDGREHFCIGGYEWTWSVVTPEMEATV